MRDRYVDDVLSGADDVENALTLRDELIQLMKAGGFPLGKWVANHPLLLEDLDADDRLRPAWITFTKDEPVKELGVRWSPREDTLGLSFPTDRLGCLCKRVVLSELATLFNPCGWVAPATLLTKMLVQDLWKARLEWDEELLASMARR
uniref:Reverse transcriptase domain-containing protein n=1 Tax=Trichogramma kaykai TaxID=54128 RepID=A0ABD2WA11_9HYME